ncbi:MAG TPA: BamA/TamA family outer membrane protein [Chlamydiales bacterium]|nr:BamA/TamA family outer membrane protein [Chlamydiales bacterium]
MKRLLLSLLAPAFLAALPYELNFVGMKDQEVMKAIFDVSDLVVLQDRPPKSINGLRYRIASDIPALLKVLHAYGYYDATVTSDVGNENGVVQVYILIHPGPQYTISSYEIFQGDCTEHASLPTCQSFTPESLGLKIGIPAVSVNIVNAELNLLTHLAQCGYPLASVEKRKVVVDMADKTVHAASCIKEGPLSKFGPVSIHGLKTVESSYVLRRLAWKEGETYTADDVEATQKRLINSDLFSSVLISHDEELDGAGELPMKMYVTEAKHRQLSIGAYYATVDGAGMTFAWINRNLRGMGEILSFNGDFSQRYLSGKITYKKPDFLTMDQTYRAIAQIEREKINAYIAFTYTFANYIDKKFNNRTNLSIGLDVEHFIVSDSASNGSYLLAGLPFFIRYNAADDLMNPTNGFSIVYQATPFQSLWFTDQHFYKQRITGTFYIPMGTKRAIFAGRIQFGSIAGTKQDHIPLPILFLGGSEDDLRGYRYKTVSPLNEHRKPYGGRSAVFFTAETRLRVTETIGIVPFADFGTVTFEQLPQFHAKWFKSVGLGLRYYTFFGPLRADIGFPLDRRRIIDPAFRIYVSIGQTF